MSYIGNPPVVQTNRLIYEEVVTVAGKTDFYPPGGYTVGANFLDVELNGNDLGSADFTATDGALVRLAVGAGIGDLVRIIAYGVSSLSNATPANGSVTTAKIVDANVTQAKLAANVAGNGPAFSAYLNSSQSITNATFTKVQCNVEEFDTNSNYDNSTNYRFTPTVAGYYQVDGSASYGSGTAGICITTIYKNGTRFKDGMVVGYNANGTSSTVSALIYFNGSTDYVELYGYQSGGTSTTFTGTVSATWFQASMVRAA